MTVCIQGERGRRRRKRWDPTSRIAILSLGFLLILSHVCLLSSAEKISPGGSRWSPARKERVFSSATSYHARVSSPSRNYKNSRSDKFEEDEKRLVHTGPNPLHN